MRRYTFYLSIALLAFGIGLLVVFKLSWKDSSESITEKTQLEIKPAEQKVDNKISPTKFSCDDEAINTVWEMLMRDETFRNDAYGNVEAHQIKSCQEYFDVKPIKLNDNENEEFIIKGNYFLFCDSGGDCQTWIVSRNDKQYKIIFYSTAGTSTTDLYVHNEIESLQTKTRGFKDLKVFIPNGWSADNIGYFKFDGNKYQLRKCLKDFNSEYVYQNDYVEKWLGVKSDECLKRNMF